MLLCGRIGFGRSRQTPDAGVPGERFQCQQSASAIDRLRADVEIEPSLRKDLELDKDTKNVPGSPAIFDTILLKIEAARVVVSDPAVTKSVGLNARPEDSA